MEFSNFLQSSIVEAFQRSSQILGLLMEKHETVLENREDKLIIKPY